MDWYRSLLRPLLFLLPPEFVHHAAGLALRAPLPWRVIAGVRDDPALRTDLAGIALRNPVGLAAGFDKNARMIRGLSSLGFGYLVVGTVTRRPRRGNPSPRIVRREGDGALVNAMGLPNDGAAAVARRLSGRSRPGIPVIVSIADEARADVLESVELLAPHADGIELNVSCPNVTWGRDRDHEDHLRALLARLPTSAKPVFVKLPPFREAAEREAVLSLARIAGEGGAAGLTCSNTRPVSESRLAVGAGGLSGRPLAVDTPRIIEEVAGAVPGLPLNACGGIATPDDARRCLDAGAASVQVYTGLIYEGPRIVARLSPGLRDALARSAARVQDG